ncbi:cysteine proteinase [Cytidiella melzeri]|nr:cysteine proteinase [Cytidiella melzeri]
MPPKRRRRASPVAQGLSAGERLKRAKLSGHDQLAWAWVGTEVTNAASITQEHRLATCGFSDSSTFPFCASKYQKASVKQENLKAAATKAEGELDDDFIVVTDEEAPNCSSKSCKNNPNCLNYLGQEKWENEEKARDAYMKAAELGPDPNDESREANTPVGLKNLGATCYANAFLQVWFQDVTFRAGVFNCQPGLDEGKFEESPIFQLQVTFAAMQLSQQTAFNPIKLVESLKLRTTEQQDAQEFSKLFMAHLDSEFQKQSDSSLKSLIADQFQGKHVYATVCSQCRNRSERESEFLEIEVNLANNAKLEERIAAILKPETLSGDNKYLCPRCDNLQDAQRQAELTELPPVLHFSLLRFVYDLSTMERKKSKQLISFPPTLDMGQFVTTGKKGSEVQDSTIQYHLRGILLHKGPSAYHGHYEAQVFDVETQSWYQFNDESVTKIDSLFAEAKVPQKVSKSGSQQSLKPGKSQAKSKTGNGKNKPVKVDSDIEILEDASSSKSPSPHTKDENRISSRDAYMLIYARSTGKDGVAQDSTVIASCRKKNRHDTAIPHPPERALQVIEDMNAQHARSCEEHDLRKQDVESRFSVVRDRIMGIYQNWQLSSNAERNVVLSRRALEQWLSYHITPHSKDKTDAKTEEMEVDSGPVTFSSSDILCEHGRLDPGQVANMKRVKKAAYDRILSEDACQFDPALSSSDVCDECVKYSFSERLYQVEHPRLVSLFDEICPVADDQCGYWVSKPWLKDWRLAKPKMHSHSQEDPPPNDPEYQSHVRCEHRGLTPNTMLRRRISAEAYELLRTIFPDWTTLSTDDEQCAVCEALIHMSKVDKREARIQAEEEKAKLKHMHDNALTGGTKLLDNVPCAIIPAQFIRAWKQWLFRPAELPRPESVDNSRFICRHGLLALDPNCASDLDANVAVIMRSDWDILEHAYSGGPLIALEHDGDRWSHSPDVCEDCRKERKSTFDMTELTIRLLRSDDPNPTPETYAAGTSEKLGPVQQTLITYGSRKTGPVRQSRRIRQVKESCRKRKVTVTRTMSVKDLKVQIQEELDIPTISQRLYYQGVELEDNKATIGALGVLSNDTLDLREQLEDADLFGSNTEAEPRRREEGQGFGGTLLGNGGRTSSTPHSSQHEEDLDPDPSGRPCPMCTFENATDAVACLMCETMFSTH